MTWSLVWSLGGQAGMVEDLDVQWSESISLTRQTGNWRRASIDVLLPIDMRTQRAHPRTGAATLFWNGVQVIDGPWRAPSYQQTSDGRARVQFELSDDDEDDRGTWPPVSMQYPRRGPREISSSQIVIEPGPRTWGGRLPGRWTDVPILSSMEFPNIAAPAEGATWPYPIGSPGRGRSIPAAPAYVYDTRITGGNERKAGISGVPVDCATITVYGPTRDVWRVAVTAATNAYTYTLVLRPSGMDTQTISYTSDGSATADEIVAGLASAWNNEQTVTGTAIASADIIDDVVWLRGVQAGAGFYVTSPDADITITHYSIASQVTPQNGVSVYHESRDDGTAYAFFKLGDLTDIDQSPQNQFWWSADAGATGNTDATPSGAGDVLVSIMAASSLAVDWAEWSRVADRLNRYKIDGYCDAPVSPLAFANAAILPLLPLSVVPGPAGLRPVLWPWLDDTSARGLDLVDGIGIAVSERVSYLDAPSLQAMTVRYAYDAASGRCVGRAVADFDSTVYGSLFSVSSDVDEFEARYIADDTTAQQVATDALRWLSWSPRVLDVQLSDLARFGPGAADDLYPGRRVVLTCDRLGIDAVAAVVGEREWDASTALVRLYLLDDPLTAT